MLLGPGPSLMPQLIIRTVLYGSARRTPAARLSSNLASRGDPNVDDQLYESRRCLGSVPAQAEKWFVLVRCRHSCSSCRRSSLRAVPFRRDGSFFDIVKRCNSEGPVVIHCDANPLVPVAERHNFRIDVTLTFGHAFVRFKEFDGLGVFGSAPSTCRLVSPIVKQSEQRADAQGKCNQ
ncbi:hypothetical protein BRAS3809_1570002 [Bradyrhizobium sp. STM 3809]|nr:hypothetical protein BRAS3809_1570002 [Bradyrhizobium sp. STM 3809]